MHPLLIQQAIIDEIVRQAFIDGNKALNETKFDGQRIMPTLLAQKLTFDEIQKWVAHLAMDGYILLTSDDHHRNPMYITLTKTGSQAEISKYFKEQWKERKRILIKDWTQITSQLVLGTIGLIAFLITTGKSCTNSSKDPQPPIQVLLKYPPPETKTDSSLHKILLYLKDTAKVKIKIER